MSLFIRFESQMQTKVVSKKPHSLFEMKNVYHLSKRNNKTKKMQNERKNR